jgi:hypothetical protein
MGQAGCPTPWSGTCNAAGHGSVHPRTAEVVGEAVLLARDEQIENPTLLAQLRT